MADLVNPRDLGKDRYTSDGRDIFEPPGPKAKINAGITLKENADLQENQNPSIDQHSLEDTNLPNRPAFAKIGVSVDLRANLFEISLSDSQQLFPYKAEFDQRLQDNKRQTGWFFQTILQELPELKSMGDGVATDYASLLVTSAKIDLGPTNRKTFTMGYYKRGGQGDPVRAGAKPFEFTLSSLPPITSADLSRYVGSSPAILGESESTDSEVIRTLNVIIAGHPNKDPGVYQGGQGRLFRYPTRSEASSFDLQGGLIAVRGYFYSVRFATLRVLLNVHGQCNPFYKVGDARALMQEFKDLVGEKAGALEGFFHLLKVRTSYMKANGKPITNFRTVVGLSAGNANDTKFKQTGRQPEATISVAQYFSSQYGVTLKYPEKRVLNCGTAIRPVWIPAELCFVMQGQRCISDLHESQTTRMLTIAARPPAENARRIVAADGGLGLIGVLPQRCPTLAAFGITIDPQMVVIPGRVLSSPRLKYGGSVSIIPKGGAWNMSGKKFLKSAVMPSWTLLRIGVADEITDDVLASKLKALTDVFTKCGLKNGIAKEFPGPSIDFTRMTNGERTLDKALERVFEECQGKGISFLLVILPSADSWLFSRVKFWGDVRYGIRTSCVQLSQLRKANVNISANISLKVNLKLGGTNQGISSPPDLGFLRHGNTMVVGIDVTHPAPDSIKGAPSIAGIVASIDADFTQWPGNIRCQERRQEMVSNLDILVEERLRLWVSNNPKKKLENMMIYRDGVSDGQYETVLREEVPAIRKACAFLGYSPKFTVIIAVKRHHTRFYPTDKKKADPKHNHNIQNGTVVDRHITMRRGWDFFMAPHVALQGTTKPCHYVVILDEIKDSQKLGADNLEQITHNLCYLHGTTTSAVSVCPPAYYADLICERGRCYIADYLASNKFAKKDFNYNETPWRQGVHQNLKDSMFYV